MKEKKSNSQTKNGSWPTWQQNKTLPFCFILAHHLLFSSSFLSLSFPFLYFSFLFFLVQTKKSTTCILPPVANYLEVLPLLGKFCWWDFVYDFLLFFWRRIRKIMGRAESKAMIRTISITLWGSFFLRWLENGHRSWF